MHPSSRTEPLAAAGEPAPSPAVAAGLRKGPEGSCTLVRAAHSGVVVGIRTSPDLASVVRRCLPPGAAPARGRAPQLTYSLQHHDDAFVLSATARTSVRETTLDRALDRLEDLVRFDLACAASEYLFVHAGVVAVERQAVLIPGASGAGKSSLVAALIAAGATYYSDEFALIDARGRVHPYAQKLALADRGEGARSRALPQAKRRLSPRVFGARVGQRPLAVGLVLVTRYRPGGRFRPVRLAPAQAVLELFAHVVRARAAPQQALARLERVVRHARTLESIRGEAEELARLLVRNRLFSSTHQPRLQEE